MCTIVHCCCYSIRRWYCCCCCCCLLFRSFYVEWNCTLICTQNNNIDLDCLAMNHPIECVCVCIELWAHTCLYCSVCSIDSIVSIKQHLSVSLRLIYWLKPNLSRSISISYRAVPSTFKILYFISFAEFKFIGINWQYKRKINKQIAGCCCTMCCWQSFPILSESYTPIMVGGVLFSVYFYIPSTCLVLCRWAFIDIMCCMYKWRW